MMKTRTQKIIIKQNLIEHRSVAIAGTCHTHISDPWAINSYNTCIKTAMNIQQIHTSSI